MIALALALAVTGSAPDLKAMRDHARKVNTPAAWYELAENARTPFKEPSELPAELRAQLEKSNAKAPRTAIFREATSHLDAQAIAALAATLSEPEVNAAMVRALRLAKRDDEAAAECRATFARWTPADVPYVLEACKDCKTQPFSTPAGPASHSVFRQWISVDTYPYHAGLVRGLKDMWIGRVRLQSANYDPITQAATMTREPVGLLVGDPSETWRVNFAAERWIPFVAVAPAGPPNDSTRSAALFRPFVARPGPEARAKLLLDAARGQGARKIVLVLPDEGGDRSLADAIDRAADVSRVVYTAGRREHREDAQRVRATGADAIVLLGPGEESADWLPFLKGTKLLMGTDELDPSGFHDPRLLEGAIFVRSRYTPPDSLDWNGTSAASWVAGWVVGDAMTHGADSPALLLKALTARATEADAANQWLSVPPEVAKIEVMRVRGGKTEKLP